MKTIDDGSERARSPSATSTSERTPLRRDIELGGKDDEADEGGRETNARDGGRRRATVAVAVAVAVVALIGTFEVTGRAYERYAYGVSDEDDAIARTKAQYGDGKRDKLRELRWTPKEGFFLVGGDGWFCKSWFGNSNFDTKARDAIRESVKRYFPTRIADDATPFSILFTTADSPWTPCVDRDYAKANCDFKTWVPIIAFGSTPRDETLLPPIRPGPLVTLLDCYTDRINEPPTPHGQAYNETPSCEFLNYVPEGTKYAAMAKCEANSNSPACAPYKRGLFTLSATEDESQYAWSALIPKAFWRGNDFTYLTTEYPNHRPASEPYLKAVWNSDNRTETMRTMLNSHGLGPRGRAVFMSKLSPSLVDAKFFDWGSFTHEPSRHALGVELGVDAPVRATEETLAKYRYQLDLGGVGGTTWTGTISKLSMPGVLLHHETDTVDSYFETLKPYVHYMPVDLELRTLEEKVKWLEDNPESAVEMATNAHKWVEWFRQVSILLGYNHEKLVLPLREIIDPDDVHYLKDVV